MKSVIKQSLCASIIFLICSCSGSKTPDVLLSYDEVAGFMQHPTLVTNQSHSGKTSVCVSPEQIYGICFKKQLNAISNFSPNKVIISVWVYTENNQSEGNLVVALDDASDKNVYWNALYSKSANIEPGKWTKISSTMDIKKVNNPSNKIVIYALNNGKSKIWFDDVTVDFE